MKFKWFLFIPKIPDICSFIIRCMSTFALCSAGCASEEDLFWKFYHVPFFLLSFWADFFRMMTPNKTIDNPPMIIGNGFAICCENIINNNPIPIIKTCQDAHFSIRITSFFIIYVDKFPYLFSIFLFNAINFSARILNDSADIN